jgi:hypothetical protein
MKQVTDTAKRRLKLLQPVLQKQGYSCTAQLADNGRPYLLLDGGYRVIYFDLSEEFKLVSPNGNMLVPTFMKAKFLELSKGIYETPH